MLNKEILKKPSRNADNLLSNAPIDEVSKEHSPRVKRWSKNIFVSLDKKAENKHIIKQSETTSQPNNIEDNNKYKIMRYVI